MSPLDLLTICISVASLIFSIPAFILYIKLLKYNEYAYTPSIGTVRDVFIDSHQRKSFTSYFYNTEVDIGDELSFLIKLNIGKVKIRQKVQ